MKVINKKLTEIKPYENNPRDNDEAVQYVRNSIEKFGFRVPLVVDKEGVIVTGHTRYRAAQEMGLKEVPCIMADDLTPEQVRAFRIADNKVHDMSSWDNDKLRDELNALTEFDMTDFGFGEFELDILKEDLTPEPYDNEMLSEYDGHGEEFLVGERVIIKYNEDTRAALCAKLGVDLNKITYNAEDIINA